ncbi:CARDB domain-containing protein, partial [Propionivibrio sp.]|uniref:CARDB domain-containing protein n=1 Tax=Propionivibrio sp. TaxID=2212460 RepID=UPI0026030AD8
MRNAIDKNDRPDRLRNLTLSPLMSALLRTFGPAQWQARAAKTAARPTPRAAQTPAIRFEALEPRVLLSGDPAVAVMGSIDVPGEVDQYGFTLPQNTRVVFDSLTNTSSINWTLQGPQGAVVSNRPLSQTDASGALGNPLLDLAAGDYTLTLDANADVTGAYSLRLIDVQKSDELTPGTVLNSQLTPANETDVYRFSASAGERVNFQLNSDGGQAYYRLYDPFGKAVFGPSQAYGANDVRTLELAGSYTLLVEGSAGSIGVMNYSVNVQPITNHSDDLSLGTLVSGSLDQPTQVNSYHFSLGESKLLYFDALTNRNDLTWTLSGPRGVVVSGRPFDRSDSYDFGVGAPIANLVAGDYTLTVAGTGNAQGDYRFRLSDLTQATAIEPGTEVSGELASGNATALYKFTASALDRYYFDALDLSGGEVYWRLLDPYGQIVCDRTALDTDLGLTTLAYTGVYTLLIEGRINSTVAASYRFKAQRVIDDSAPLVWGQTVAGRIDQAGQRDRYTVTLDAAKRVYLDTFASDAELTLSLTGPQGEVLRTGATRTSTAPTLRTIGPDGMDLVYSGDQDDNPFELSLPFAIQFLGQSYSSVFVGPNGYITFGSGASTYSGLGPQNPALPGIHICPSDLRLSTLYTLASADTYKIRVEGFNYGSSFDATPLVYEITFHKNSDAAELDLISVSSPSAGGITDGFSASYLSPLTPASGTSFALSGQNIVSIPYPGTSATGVPKYLDLVAGSYTLTVAGAGDTVANYSLRLFDLGAALALTPGTAVSGELSAANDSVMYKFTVTAGDGYAFNEKAISGGSASWTVINPFGSVFSWGDFTSLGSFGLSYNGVYTLLLKGDAGASTPIDYTFNLERTWNGTGVVEPWAGTPLTLGETVSGMVTTADEPQTYVLNLDAATRVYFDALSAVGGMRWTLYGPNGTLVDKRAFESSDGVGLGLGAPVYDLVAGSYRLTIDDGAGTGAYSFRVLDTALAPVLPLNTAVSNTLSPGNETDLYQFAAIAGERYYFDYQSLSVPGSGVCWRLLDPYGHVAIDKTTFNADAGPFTLDYDGTYTLLIEGHSTLSGDANYQFKLQKVTDGQAVLPLDALVSGSITQVGQRNRYTFTLDAAKQVYFDALTNTSSLTWTLTGPRGAVVSNRAFNQSDAMNFTGTPLLDLMAGAYTLIIDGTADALGSYDFRLRDLSAATPLPLGTTVASTLTPGNETDLYQFTASAGERYYFDYLSATGSPAWRLLDPWGGQVFGPSLMSSGDRGVLTLALTGTYTLLIEGSVSGSTVRNYSFAVQKVTDDSAVLPLGALVNGVIAYAGQRDFYTFTLDAAKRVYFDALTNIGALTWTLSGPSGRVVAARSFTASDGYAFGPGSPLLDLAAGDYTLMIEGMNDTATGASYGFRLLDASQATVIVPGVVVSPGSAPANRTDLYQFTANAGDRYFFDRQTASGVSIYYRLINAAGRVVIDRTFFGDQGPFTLEQSGTYTLLIEGDISMTGNGSYSFNLQKVSDDTPSLALNTLTTGAIDHVGQRDLYSFTLDTAKPVYFDAQTNNSNLTWTLSGPRGELVSNRSFTASDAGGFGISPLLDLAAGTYTLIIDGAGDTAVPYTFRLLDLSAATPLNSGTPVNDELNPGKETDPYQFTATAGDRYYVQYLGSTGSVYWRLLDPWGAQVAGPTSMSSGDIGLLTLALSGTYTLLIEGSVANTGAATYNFNVLKVTDKTIAVTEPLGTPVNGSIDYAGQRASYTFTLNDAKQVYFDSLTNATNLSWTLSGPHGAVVTRGFTASDGSGLSTSPLLDLAAGVYTLTVAGNAATVGAYSFRLLDFSAATLLDPGTPVSDVLNPGKETDLYKFVVTSANSQYYFDFLSASTSDVYWRLLDPWGGQVFGPTSMLSSADMGLRTFALPGTYTLLIEGKISNTSIATYSFNVQQVTDDNIALPTPLDIPVNGTIGHAGQRDFYTFTLDTAKSVYFDALTDDPFFAWTLAGPRGKVVDARTFTASDFDDFGRSPLLDLVAGTYTLMIDLRDLGNNNPVGNYSFCLRDFAAATTLTPGATVSSTLNPGNETDLYKFAVTAGQQYAFDFISSSGNPHWRLLDPWGGTVFGPVNMGNGDIGPLTFAYTGTYTVLIEGSLSVSAAVSYSFKVDLVGNVALPGTPAGTLLNLGVQQAGSLLSVGQKDYYTLTLATDTRLYFDTLSDSSSKRWSLAGPRGTVVSNRGFNNSDAYDFGLGAPIYNLVAGTYLLTVDGTATGGYNFRVLDTAQAPTLTLNTPVIGQQLNPSRETDLYQFNAVAGERYYFDYRNLSVSSSFVDWRLLDPNGQVVIDRTAFDTDVGPFSVDLSGTYTLLIEGRSNLTSVANYQFMLQKVIDDPLGLTLDSTINGAIDHPGQRDFYTFTLETAKAVYFDALTNNSNLTWTLSGPRGLVSSRSFSGSDAGNLSSSPLLDLTAGAYTLIIDGTTDSVPAYSFRLRDLSLATPLTSGAVVNATLNPGNETDLYQFTVSAGERYYFDYLSASNTYWRLLDPWGVQVFGPSAMSSDTIPFTLALSGTYTLLIEGAVSASTASSYSFKIQKITDQTINLANPLGVTVDGAIDHVGQRDLYTFTLNEAKHVYMDKLSYGNFFWQLIGPRGNVASDSFTGDDSAGYDLPAGDYTLILRGGADSVGSYSFRLLDFSSATPLTTGTPVSSQLNHAYKTDLYQFTATAGEQYYVDYQGGTPYAYADWSLIDPWGRRLLGPTPMLFGDLGLLNIAVTGTYTLVISGTSGVSSVDYSFNVNPVPISAKIILTGLGSEPGPDLVVHSLTATPQGGPLHSGGSVVLSWETFNAGDEPTAGLWQDRIIVRNTTLGGAIIGNYLVNYTDIGALPLAPGAGRPRTITLTLPDGELSVGNLSFEVMADVENDVTEHAAGGMGELNNSASIVVVSQLAPYADLQVSNLAIEPAGAWVAGQSVTVHWRVGNSGNAPVQTPWSDHLQIRNLTSGQNLLSADLRYDPAVSGDLAADGAFTDDRSYTFDWPAGALGAGQIEFVVTTDYAAEIVENNAGHTAEANNTGSVSVASGPDLVVRNLHVEQSDLTAGGLVTALWEDWNDGAVPVPAGFNERIVVINRTTGETLRNVSQAYDPEQPGAGLIGAGDFRSRRFNFSLPEGLRGVGDIEIQVTADQNSAGVGVLFETNATGDAKSNNRSTIQTSSTAKPYADLVVSGVTLPTSGFAGGSILVSFTVTNSGEADTASAWNDQIIFSSDAVIGNSDDIVLDTVPHTELLTVGNAYSTTRTVTLPFKPEGRYYLWVKTDSAASVLEPDTRANNTSAAAPIDLIIPYADLNLLEVHAPLTAQSGENIRITWDVQNNGNTPTNLALWNDRVVLSSDATLGGADDIILAGSVTHAGLLAVGQSYTGAATITLPIDLAGDYYVIVQTNSTSALDEAGHSAN